MAVPKVFVSSTCFDLGEVRDQLSRFIRSYGFEPILSEYGDVFYHPDLHTHEACLHEVQNCQLFILIIGGRFGGEYIHDKTKSITNAEYDAAKSADIPVFCYVKNNILSNQHVYKKNKGKTFAKEIEYPAIENQKYAEDIFNFIEIVRRSSFNNGVEGFDNFIDIESHLRKQWAGMFFDFLKTREVRKQIDVTNHLLTGIKDSSAKLEGLVKSLYKSFDHEHANTAIEEANIYDNTQKFFDRVFDYLEVVDIVARTERVFDFQYLCKVLPTHETWYEYLIDTGFFKYFDGDETEIVFYFDGMRSDSFLLINIQKNLQKYFIQGVKRSTETQRMEIMQNMLIGLMF